MNQLPEKRHGKFVLLLVLLLAVSAMLACGESGTSNTSSRSGSICSYADKAASYLLRTQDALEGAKSHIGSSVLLQDDIEKLAALARDFKSITAPVGTQELRTRTTLATSAAAGLLEEFQAGLSGQSASSHYLTSLEAAIDEIKRIRKSNGCS